MTILVDFVKWFWKKFERILALLINLNRLHSNVLCVKFGEMGPVVQERRHVFPLSLYLWKERGPSFQHNGILWTKKTDKKRWSEVKRGTAFQPPLLVSIPYEVGVFEFFFDKIQTSLYCGILDVLFVKDQLLNSYTSE